MMTKIKLDELLNQVKKDTSEMALDQAKLNSMIDVALTHAQERKKITLNNVVAFPSRLAFGGGALGLVAAMLIVVLNLPTNQTYIQQKVVNDYQVSKSVQSDDGSFTSEEMLDYMFFETLDV